jgi:murein DD-endopeptidase MepM/ murein hydrolase activator NlpD
VAAAPTPEAEEQPTETEPTVVETIAPEVTQTVSMPEIEVDDTPVAAEAPRLIVSPLNGSVLAAFSVDQLAYDPTMEDWRIHDGVDIAAKPGTTVLAASSGTVLAVEDDALMGTTVVISHDGGYQTTYANLQAQPTVQAGDSVSAGQIIGAVGTTAAAESAQSPHLHFAVSKDGDVVDPEEFLGK